MPSYEYAGPGSRVYPETRDANGRPLGTVDPGDRRFFDDGPPDHMWTALSDDERERKDAEDAEDAEAAAKQAEAERAAVILAGGNPDPGSEDEAGTAEGAAPVQQPGQPVPPAVIP